MSVSGRCQEKFEALRTAFEDNFSRLGETGAEVAVYLAGELVCSLRGGIAAPASQSDAAKPWTEETIVMPYSVSKPLAALCCLLLIDRGLLRPEALVAETWPQWATGGKEQCSVRQLLEHRAGIPFAPEGCKLGDILDWRAMLTKIAAEPAVWPPGEVQAEHAMTFGHLCAALVHNLAGVSLGTFFQKEVAEPLGLKLYFGVPEEELPNCAELSPWPAETVNELKAMTELAPKGLFEPDVLCDSTIVNSPSWRQAEIPAVNVHGRACDVAKVYALLLNGGELEGVRLLKESTVQLLSQPSPPGFDKVFGFECSWALGFQHRPWATREGDIVGPSSRFGLGGIGGSSAFAADWEGRRVSFAYLTRQMGNWDRAENLEDTLLRCLASL